MKIFVQALLRYPSTMIQLKSGLTTERIDPIEKPVRLVFASALRCALDTHGFDPDAPDEAEPAKAGPIG
jgi:hypothetical protein